MATTFSPDEYLADTAVAGPEFDADEYLGIKDFSPDEYLSQPAEFDQADEQAEIERKGITRQDLQRGLGAASKTVTKLALGAENLRQGKLKWPTDEEIQTSFVSPELINSVIDPLGKVRPDSAATGVLRGVGDFISSSATPENIVTLGIAPQGRLAQRVIAGVFLGQGLLGSPEEIKAFNEAKTPGEKWRIGTRMGLSIALPAAGMGATFMKAKIEPGQRAGVQSETARVPQTPDSIVENQGGEVVQPPEIAASERGFRSTTDIPQRTPQPEISAEAAAREAEYQRMAANLEELNKDQFLPDRPIEPGIEAAIAEIQRRNAPENVSGIKEASTVPVEPTGQKVSHAEFKQATDSLSAMARISESVPDIEMPLTIVDKFKEQYRGEPFPKDQNYIYWSESRPPSQVSGYDRSFPVEYDARSGWIIRDKPYSSQEIQSKGLLPFSEEAKEHLLNSTAKPGAKITFADGSSALVSNNTRNPNNPIRVTMFDKGGNPTGHAEGKTAFARLGYNYGNKLAQISSIEHAGERHSVLPPQDSRPTSTKNASTIGISNAEVAAQREAMGFPESARAIETRGFDLLMEEAKAELAQNPEASRSLVKALNDNERLLTSDKDVALLAHRTVETRLEYDNAMKALDEMPSDPVAVKRLTDAREAMFEVWNADDVSGTPVAQALAARKMKVRDDFSPAYMEAETRALANQGKPLSEPQLKDVSRKSKKIKQKKEALDAITADEEFRAAFNEAKAESKAKGFGFKASDFFDRMDRQAQDRIIARRGRLYSDPLGVQQIAHLADEAIIGAAHIGRGLTKFADWSAKMVSQFGDRIKPYLKDLFLKSQQLYTEVAKADTSVKELAINRTRAKSLQSQIEALEQQIITGEKPQKRKNAVPYTKYTAGLKVKRDALKNQLDIIIRGTPEERAIAGHIKRISNLTEKLREKTTTGDFTKQPKKERRISKKESNARFEYERAKEEYLEGLEDSIRANRTSAEKFWGGIREVADLSRTMLTGWDFPPLFRQAGMIVYGQNPIRTIVQTGKALRTVFSDAELFRKNQELLSRPNAPNYLRDGLALTDFSKSTRRARMEENIASRWLRKLPKWTLIGPFLRGSGRMFTTLMNHVRADAYDNLISPDMTPFEAAHITRGINDATGRSRLGRKGGKAEAAAPWINSFAFAARLLVSRFRLATGAPLLGGTLRSKKVVAGMYARTLIGFSTIYGLGIAAGATVELDPRSSDFMKLKFGNTRLDPTFGLSSVTVLLTRLATGETKSERGRIEPLRETWRPLNLFRASPARDRIPFRGRTTWDTMADFLRTKLAPMQGNAVNAIVGENVVGETVTPADAAIGMVTPINFGDIVDAMEEQGMERGAAITFVSQWGMSMQTYDNRRRSKK